MGIIELVRQLPTKQNDTYFVHNDIICAMTDELITCACALLDVRQKTWMGKGAPAMCMHAAQGVW